MIVCSCNMLDTDMIKECIDNVCYKECKNISFNCALDSKGYLKKFSISDDYLRGFKDIKKEGTSNPFNFTHMREGHKNDLETSQFGVGFKAAAVASCDKLTVYTQVNGIFYKILCDFDKMANEEFS